MTPEISQNTIVIIKTYNAAKKAQIDRYRSTESGRQHHRDANKRYYNKRKAEKASAKDTPSSGSDSEAEIPAAVDV